MQCRPAYSRAAARGSGFTLVELLVVIGVIGILVALLLPAIQASREAARRAQCRNHLKQIGLGVSLHEQTMRALPIGSTDHGGKQLSWMVMLLPFIEEDHVREMFNFQRKFSHPDNRAAASTVIPIFLCPSTARLAPGRADNTVGDKNGNGAYDPGDDLAVTDYGGNYGAGMVSPLDNGLLIYDHAIKLKDIRDGTTHTIVASEDTGRGWTWDGEWANGGNVFDQIGYLNQQQNNEMWSDHPGGLHVLMADGSVHFLSESIDLPVIRALCTRAGQEILHSPLGD